MANDSGETEFLIFAIIMILFAVAIVIWVVRFQPYFSPNNEDLDRIRNKLRHVHPVVDSIKFFESDSSYTEDKEDIFLCIRDGNGDLYDDNTLCYVGLHEIAHVLTRSVGHTEEFNEVFTKLLKKAADQGIYNPNQPIAPMYCGVHIPENARTHDL